MEELGISNNTDLLKYAMKHGLVPSLWERGCSFSRYGIVFCTCPYRQMPNN
jgi:hypothetical protein